MKFFPLIKNDLRKNPYPSATISSSYVPYSSWPIKIDHKVVETQCLKNSLNVRVQLVEIMKNTAYFHSVSILLLQCEQVSLFKAHRTQHDSLQSFVIKTAPYKK